MHRLTGDGACVVAGEKHRDEGNVVRLRHAPPYDRCLFDKTETSTDFADGGTGSEVVKDGVPSDELAGRRCPEILRRVHLDVLVNLQAGGGSRVRSSPEQCARTRARRLLLSRPGAGLA